MEWIIAIIVIVFLWDLFTGDNSKEIKSIIGKAYQNEGEILSTDISWIHTKRFAKKRGVEVSVWDDGGESVSVDMLVNGDNVTVTLTKNPSNHTTFISADNSDRLREERKKRFGLN